MKDKQTKILSIFALAMISVAAIVNLRNLPIMASVGLNAVFFYILAAILFLIPSALVCAELASSWPEAGGVYMWVEKAFGKKLGLLSIWSEWFNNVISFPANMSFIAATLAYIFLHHLDHHRLLMFAMMLTIIWGCTLFNFLGVKASSKLNIIGAVIGSLLPGAIIILLGIIWIYLAKPIQIHFNINNILPPLHIKNIVFFLGVLSGYAGMQITAFHATNVKNPQRNFPRAIAIATILILILTIAGSLAISMVVPQKQLSLVSGVIQGFYDFFKAFHMTWALPVLAALIGISGISTLSAWLLGPARGLAVAAQQGMFPKWCAKENKRGIPTNILLLQAVIASCLALVFLITPSLSTAFWMLIVLTSQFTLIMYILIFSAAIRLRYLHKEIARPFKIPGGNIGLWLIAGSSIIICTIGIVIGYFPPENLKIGNLRYYETFLIIGNFLYIMLPFIIYKFSRGENYA